MSLRTPRVAELLLAAVQAPEKRATSLRHLLERATRPELVALVSLASEHRLAGVVYRSLRESDFDGYPVDELRQAYRAAAATHLSLTAQLARLTDQLNEVGHPWLVVKGPVLVELAYGGDAGLRQYGDLDLVTTRGGYGPIITRIEQAGGSCLEANWPLLERLRHGEITMRLPDGGYGDLHWHFIYYPEVRSRFTVAMDDFFERAITVRLRDVPVRTLEPTDELIYICLHGALSGGHQLIWLKDIERILAKGAPDWEEVGRRAARYRLRMVCALMLERARFVLSADVSRQAVDAITSDRAVLKMWRLRQRVVEPRAWARRSGTGRTLMAATAADSSSTLRTFARSLSTDVPRYYRNRLVGRTTDHDGVPAAFRHVGSALDREQYLTAISAEP